MNGTASLQSGQEQELLESLVVSDLTVAYGRRVVLRDVSAAVRRGQVVGIIGPNGGGKSTLLKAILGIIPIVSGRILAFGQPVSRMRGRMAYVPQREVIDWDFPVTVEDVVMMGRYPRGRWPHIRTRRDREVVREMLARVEMTAFAGRQIGQLSGGQQQRVFIARALAQEADIFILDEPMTGIDAGTQEVVFRIIEEQRQAGKMVLMATHDLASASCACDCLCCVNQRMVSYGSIKETYTDANLSATFGGPVIVLGRPGAPAVHSHDGGEHHHHSHENLGREHD